MTTRESLKVERSELNDKYKALVNDKENFNTEQADNMHRRIEEINNQLLHMDNAEKVKSADAGESKEIKSHFNSFAQVVKSVVSNKPDSMLYNMTQDARKEAEQAGVQLQSERSIVLSPTQLNAIMNATLTTDTGGSGGGNALPTEERGYIEKLRDRLVLNGLQAQFLPGLRGKIDYTAEVNTATATWEGENDAIAESTATFTKRQLDAKRLGVLLPVSNQWLAQDASVYDSMIERQLLNAAAEKIENAAIAGTGSNGQPTGILASGATELFAGGAAADGTNANGAALIFDDIIALEKAVAVNNADVGSLGYLTNAKVRGALKTTKIDAGSGLMIWNPTVGDSLNGYNAATTNLVPSNLTKGGASDLSAIIFGNFRDLIIGQWGGIELLVDPYTNATTGITRMIINHYVDVLVSRPESFAFIDDVVA